MSKTMKRALFMTLFIICVLALTVVGASAASYESDALAIEGGMYARIGDEGTSGVYYATFEEAVSAVTSGQTISLLQNVTATAGLGKNAFTLQSADAANPVTLTICGSYWYDGPGSGTLTVKDIHISCGSSCFTWLNGEGLIIENATFTSTGSNPMFYAKGSSTLTITSGTFTHSGSGHIVNIESGSPTVTISGGTFTNGTGKIINKAGTPKVTITNMKAQSDAAAVTAGAAARVGDEGETAMYYSMLYDAISAVENNGTVYMIQNYDVKKVLGINKAVTIRSASDKEDERVTLTIKVNNTIDTGNLATTVYTFDYININAGAYNICWLNKETLVIGANAYLYGSGSSKGLIYADSNAAKVIVKGKVEVTSGSNPAIYLKGNCTAEITGTVICSDSSSTGSLIYLDSSSTPSVTVTGNAVLEHKGASGYIFNRVDQGNYTVNGTGVKLIAHNEVYIFEQGWTNAGGCVVTDAYLYTEREDGSICYHEGQHLTLTNVQLASDAAAKEMIVYTSEGKTAVPLFAGRLGAVEGKGYYYYKGQTTFDGLATQLATAADTAGLTVKLVDADGFTVYVATNAEAVENVSADFNLTMPVEIYADGATDSSTNITLSSTSINGVAGVIYYTTSETITLAGAMEELGLFVRIGGTADSDEGAVYYASWATMVAALTAKGPGKYTVYVVDDYTGVGTTINLNKAGWDVSIIGLGATAPKLNFTSGNPFLMNASDISLSLENVEITVATYIVLSDGNGATNAKFTVKSGTTIKTAATFSEGKLFYLYDPCDVTIEAGAKIDTTGTTFSSSLWVFDMSEIWKSTLTMNGEVIIGGTFNNAQMRVFNSTVGLSNVGKVVTNSTTKVTVNATGLAKDVSGIFVVYDHVDINGGTYHMAAGTKGHIVYTGKAGSKSGTVAITITGNTVMIHEGEGVVLNKNGGNDGAQTVDGTEVQLIAKGAATMFRSPYYIIIKGAYMSCEAANPCTTEAAHMRLQNVSFASAEMAKKFGESVYKVGDGTKTITVEGESIVVGTGYYVHSTNGTAKNTVVTALNAAINAQGLTVKVIGQQSETIYVASLADASRNVYAGAKIYASGADDSKSVTLTVNGFSVTLYYTDETAPDAATAFGAEVARIDDTENRYTIPYAEKLVADGGTIYITADYVHAAGQITFASGKNITIVGDSAVKVITNSTSTAYLFKVEAGTTVTVDDLTLKTAGPLFYVVGTLNLEDGVTVGNIVDGETTAPIVTTSGKNLFYTAAGSVTNLNGATINVVFSKGDNDGNCGPIWLNGGTFNVNSGTAITITTGGYDYCRVENAAVLTLNGGATITVYGTGDGMEVRGTVIIDNANIYAYKDSTKKAYHHAFYVNGGSVYVYGATVRGTCAGYNSCIYVLDTDVFMPEMDGHANFMATMAAMAAKVGNPNVAGTEITLPDGSTVTVYPTGAYFTTMEAATKGIANDNNIIYLLRNYTTKTSITKNNSVTGYTLTSVDHVNITLTVGSAWLFDLGGGSAVVPTLKNITINVGNNNLGYFNNVSLIIDTNTTITGAGNSSGLILMLNGTNITVNDGTFTPTGTNAVFVGNKDYPATGTLTIKGGTFNAGYWVFDNNKGSMTVDIQGGIFKQNGTVQLKGFFLQSTSSTFKMSGGSITVTNTLMDNVIRADGTATITGGSITINTEGGAMKNNPLRFAKSATISNPSNDASKQFKLTTNYTGGTIYLAAGTLTISAGKFENSSGAGQMILTYGGTTITISGEDTEFTHGGTGTILCATANVTAKDTTTAGNSVQVTVSGGTFKHTGTSGYIFYTQAALLRDKTATDDGLAVLELTLQAVLDITTGTFECTDGAYIIYTTTAGITENKVEKAPKCKMETELNISGGTFVHSGTKSIVYYGGWYAGTGCKVKVTGTATMIHEGSGAADIFTRGGGALIVDGVDVKLIARGNNYIFENGYQNSIAGFNDSDDLIVKGAYLSTGREDGIIVRDDASTIYINFTNITLDSDTVAGKIHGDEDLKGTSLYYYLLARLDCGTREITIPKTDKTAAQTKTVYSGYYMTFAAAWAAATGDDFTIYFTRDQDGIAGSTHTINGNVTLQLNGHTVAAAEESNVLFDIKTGAMLTILNGTFNSSNPFFTVNGTLALENITITAAGTGNFITSVGGDVTVTNCVITLSGAASFIHQSKGGYLTMTDGSLTVAGGTIFDGTQDSTGYAAGLASGGEARVNGTAITVSAATNLASEGQRVYITDASITAGSNLTLGTISISGGDKLFWANVGYDGSNAAALQMNLQTANNRYHSDLKDAFAAAMDTDATEITITVIGTGFKVTRTTGGMIIPAGKTVTINGNSKTMKVNGLNNEYLFVVNGTLVLNSLTITECPTKFADVTGTLDMNGVTVTLYAKARHYEGPNKDKFVNNVETTPFIHLVGTASADLDADTAVNFTYAAGDTAKLTLDDTTELYVFHTASDWAGTLNIAGDVTMGWNVRGYSAIFYLESNNGSITIEEGAKILHTATEGAPDNALIIAKEGGTTNFTIIGGEGAAFRITHVEALLVGDVTCGNNLTRKFLYGVVVEVTITWEETICFTYTRGDWNPDTHTYKEGTWATNNNADQIKLQNTGTEAVTATFEYGKASGYEAINGAFKKDGNAITTLEMPGDNETVYTVVFSLSGIPSDYIDNQTIGTVTITISE